MRKRTFGLTSHEHVPQDLELLASQDRLPRPRYVEVEVVRLRGRCPVRVACEGNASATSTNVLSSWHGGAGTAARREIFFGDLRLVRPVSPRSSRVRGGRPTSGFDGPSDARSAPRFAPCGSRKCSGSSPTPRGRSRRSATSAASPPRAPCASSSAAKPASPCASGASAPFVRRQAPRSRPPGLSRTAPRDGRGGSRASGAERGSRPASGSRR